MDSHQEICQIQKVRAVTKLSKTYISFTTTAQKFERGILYKTANTKEGTYGQIGKSLNMDRKSIFWKLWSV